jgi:hypothetical protein
MAANFKCSMEKKKESLAKKSEANNDWVAYYFCKDPNGYEWAVMPHQVIGNGANVGCVNDRGGQDDIGLKYALEECEPLNQSLESSKIYKAVSDGEDRTIIPLTLADATRIANAGNDKLAVLGIIADMHLRKSEAKNKESKFRCSMEKKKESLAKKCEEYIPNVRERLWSFIDAGFITTEEIGDYLLRALSVDTLENVYGWLVQDEMIPSEETLADEH